MAGSDGVVEIIDEGDDEESTTASPDAEPGVDQRPATALPPRAPAGPLRTGSIAMVIPAQHLFGA
jgi:hypothetical protein